MMSSYSKIYTVIIGLNKGIGFRTKKPWFLHDLLGRNLLERIVDNARAIKSEEIFIIVSEGQKELLKLRDTERVSIVCRGVLKDIALDLLKAVDGIGEDDLVLVIDVVNPLLSEETIKKFALRPALSADTVYIISGNIPDGDKFKKIMRDRFGYVIDIKYEKECSEEKGSIKEVDLGYYLMSNNLFKELLTEISSIYLKEEFTVADLIEFLLYRKRKFIVLVGANADEVFSVDNESDLERAIRKLWRRKVNELLSGGVIVMDKDRCYVSDEVKIGTDVVLYPNVTIEGKTEIGNNCVIYSGSRIKDSKVGADVVIYDNSIIEGATIEVGVSIGPFARIRPGTHIMSGARIGNFVELKKTSMGRNSKANHLTYLGDAIIGDDVNIGAGTITCNYDGEKKHQTIIEDGVFVGSDTQFIAPVSIHKGAYIAAGSTITKDVPEGALGIARSKQENKIGWVRRKKKMRKKEGKN